MIELALTGGIGAGKSTVGHGLVVRGAHLVDADAIVRELQQPGRSVFEAVLESFGEKVLTSGGELDRAALAKIVFADPEQLKRLNSIVHPAVRLEMSARRSALADVLASEEDAVVILDIPLLAETASGSRKTEGLPGIAGVIVVEASPATVVRRLRERRGMSEDDARARMAAQAGSEDRLALADFVVSNDGTLDDLEREIDRCWRWIQSLPR